MKKIVVFMLMLVAMTTGSYGKDLSKEQLAIRLDVFKYLLKEGFQPKIDEDGDIKFVNDNRTFYVIVDETWSNPFIIKLYKEYLYDEEGTFSKPNIESCISAVAEYKVVKLFCGANFYSFQAEVFCENAEVFNNTFYTLMDEFEAARRRVVSTLESGLDGNAMITNKEGVFDKAMNLYREEEFEQSFPLFQILAESGYVKAYGYMGLAYELGEGTSVDKSKMVKYYEKAIENGASWCAYRLGNHYYDNAEYGEALNYYTKCGSNENGFRSEALYKAGTLYEQGKGTDTNLSQAIMCYRKSVLYASVLACDARKALMRLGEEVESRSEFVDATKTMLMGLSPEEMYERGDEYEWGLNNRYVSLPKAYAFYKASAEEGYTRAYVKMGQIYLSKYYPFNDKESSDKYYKKAFKNFKKIADSDGDACYQLGLMYLNGNGVEVDKNQAKFYFKSGSLLGDRNASWRYGLLCKEGMDYQEAFKFFLAAAEKGQGMAMYELANLYEEGLGVNVSRENAIKWYKKCANSDFLLSSDARKALRRLGVGEEKEE